MDTVKKEEEPNAAKFPPGFEPTEFVVAETDKDEKNESKKVPMMEYNDDLDKKKEENVESHVTIIAVEEEYANEEDEKQMKLDTKNDVVRQKSMNENNLIVENDDHEFEAVAVNIQANDVGNEAETTQSENYEVADNDDEQSIKSNDPDSQMKETAAVQPQKITVADEEKSVETVSDDTVDKEESKQETVVVIEEKNDKCNDNDDEIHAPEVRTNTIDALEYNDNIEKQEEYMQIETAAAPEKEESDDRNTYMKETDAVQPQEITVVDEEKTAKDESDETVDKEESLKIQQGYENDKCNDNDDEIRARELYANTFEASENNDDIKLEEYIRTETAEPVKEYSKESDVDNNQMKEIDAVQPQKITVADDEKSANDESDDTVDKEESKQETFVMQQNNEYKKAADHINETPAPVAHDIVQPRNVEASEIGDVKKEEYMQSETAAAPEENDKDAKDESAASIQEVRTKEESVDHQIALLSPSNPFAASITNQNEDVVVAEKPKEIMQPETTHYKEEDLNVLMYPPGFEPKNIVDAANQCFELEGKEESIDIPVNNVQADAFQPQQQVATQAFAASSSARGADSLESFNNVFNEYFQSFIATESSQLDVDVIKSFAEKVPKDFVVSEARYPLLFKALFKIKEIQNKVIVDSTLELIRKIFVNLDFNKFLFQFWSSTEFKARDRGPIGFSIVKDHNRNDFTEILVKDFNDAAKVKAKVVDVAWSMLLDVEDTVTKMWDTSVYNKVMSPFYLAVLRRFKCLGEYMIKIDGKETPIFLHFFRKLIVDAEYNKFMAAFTCFANICKPVKGEDGCTLLKPAIVLCEIMSLLILDDEKHDLYMVALRRFFTPTSNIPLIIEWNFESTNFDNPKVFVNHFIKYYNRKQTIRDNIDIWVIFEGFKASLKNSGTELVDFEKLDENTVNDWPFAYKVIKFLGLQDFKHQIPLTLFMVLPDSDTEKYISMEDAEPSLEKALIGIVELYFICGEIPEALYKNVWKTFDASKSLIDTFAKSVVAAFANLKKSCNLEVNCKLIDFVGVVYRCFDIPESVGFAYEMDVKFVSSYNHLMIIGRMLRLLVEEKFQKDGKKPASTSISLFFIQLLNAYSSKIQESFNIISEETWGTWPPWRNGTAPCLSDEISLAINHILNGIQKELFCVYDSTWGHSPELMDILFFLCKKRKYFGLNHPKLDAALLAKYPQFFEARERPPQRNDNGESSNLQRDSRNQSDRQQNDGDGLQESNTLNSNDYGNRQQQNQGRGGYSGITRPSNEYQRDESVNAYQSNSRGASSRPFSRAHQPNRGGAHPGSTTRQQDCNYSPPSHNEQEQSQVETAFPSNPQSQVPSDLWHDDFSGITTRQQVNNSHPSNDYRLASSQGETSTTNRNSFSGITRQEDQPNYDGPPLNGDSYLSTPNIARQEDYRRGGGSYSGTTRQHDNISCPSNDYRLGSSQGETSTINRNGFSGITRQEDRPNYDGPPSNGDSSSSAPRGGHSSIARQEEYRRGIDSYSGTTRQHDTISRPSNDYRREGSQSETGRGGHSGATRQQSRPNHEEERQRSYDGFSSNYSRSGNYSGLNWQQRNNSRPSNDFIRNEQNSQSGTTLNHRGRGGSAISANENVSQRPQSGVRQNAQNYNRRDERPPSRSYYARNNNGW